ncbi:MAG: ABC transporter ATP-binding protein [Myxococcales bacterium]|nr:ABC transporter ATP-binding protein [Myxococcales bacterium]
MIQAQGLAKSFGPQTLFEGLSWQLQPRRRYGLVGPNGAGKTTLLRLLIGELTPDGGAVLRPKGVRVGYLPQEVDDLGPGTVLDVVLAGQTGWVRARDTLARVHERMASAIDDASASTALRDLDRAQTAWEQAGGDTVEQRAREALGGLGFDRKAEREPASALSGGWRMRAALARLLVQRPDVLLLDEPTNHLDFESLAWFEDFLDGYEGAVVAVSHDRYFLDRVPTHIAELTKKGIYEYVGGYDDFVLGRAERLEQQVAQKAKVDRQRAHLQSFVERFRAKASKAKQAQSRMKMLARLENVELEAGAAGIGFRFPEPARTGKEVLTCDRVRKAWGDNVVYTSCSLTVWRGDRVALVGPNGAGKSTLLKVLADVTDIQGGEVRIGAGVRREYYAQHQLDALDPTATVYMEARRAAIDETVPQIRKVLGALLFSGKSVEKKIAVLSGGERARVALARIILRAPNLLLLDEPTNHLDLTSREVLEDALSNFAGTVVFVSHDRWFINAVATHVIEVVPGGATTLFHGDYDAYLWRKAGGDPAAVERLLRGEAFEREAAVPGQERAGHPGDGAAPLESRADAQARKRAEAERRQEMSRRTKDLRQRLEQLEAEIATSEARLKAILALQMDPALYEDSDNVRTLLLEQAGLRAKTDAGMAEWERLALRVEAVESELGLV